MSLTKFVGLLAFTAVATSATAASVEATNDTNAQIAELKKELNELKSQNGDKWLTEERASQIRGVVQDVMADADTRSSLQATAATSGYNNGFFIASPDGNFKLQINGQVQVRSSYAWQTNSAFNASKNPVSAGGAGNTNATKAQYGTEIRRAKLSFSGNVVDPSWQYRVTMAYLPAGSQVANANGSYTGSSPYNVAGSNSGNGSASTANLEDAYIVKDMGNGMSLMMGQFKSPFLREELVTSANQLGVERSVVNQMFSTGWTDGVQFTAKNDSLMGMVSFNNGGNNANFATQNMNNTDGAYSQYAITGRIQYLAFGNWAQFNDMTSMRGGGQGLMLGAGFNWQHGGNQDEGVATGGVGSANTDAGFFTYTADASWDLGGANLYGAFFGNFTSSLPTETGNVGPNTNNNGSSIQSYGALIQGGYFISDNTELFGSWQWYETANQGTNNPMSDGNNVFNAQMNNIYSAGVNIYLTKNVKFTFDTGYAMNGIVFQGGIYNQAVAGTNYQTAGNSNSGGQWVGRAQVQLVF
jgi:hypothetical protein